MRQSTKTDTVGRSLIDCGWLTAIGLLVVSAAIALGIVSCIERKNAIRYTIRTPSGVYHNCTHVWVLHDRSGLQFRDENGCHHIVRMEWSVE